MSRNLKCPTTGKDIFFTEDAARRAARHYQEKRSTHPLFVYRCPTCGHHHLTKINRQRSSAEMFAGVTGETL